MKNQIKEIKPGFIGLVAECSCGKRFPARELERRGVKTQCCHEMPEVYCV